MRQACAARRPVSASHRELFQSYFRALHRDGFTGDHAAVQHVCDFGRMVTLIDSDPCPADGGRKVDLTLRLNVLAVCAAVVFVSAVLLGAF